MCRVFLIQLIARIIDKLINYNNRYLQSFLMSCDQMTFLEVIKKQALYFEET